MREILTFGNKGKELRLESTVSYKNVTISKRIKLKGMRYQHGQRNISTKHLAHLCNVAHLLPPCTNILPHVATCCKMSNGVGSNGQIFVAKILDVARVWPAP